MQHEVLFFSPHFIDFGMKRPFSVAMHGGSVYGSLGARWKGRTTFDRFNFLFGEFFVSFLALKFREFSNYSGP